MKAHIFTFKWPRLELGLQHEELQEGEWLMVETIKAPAGAYIYTDRWYYRERVGDPMARSPGKTFIRHGVLDPHRVPKLIRMHLLLVT